MSYIKQLEEQNEQLKKQLCNSETDLANFKCLMKKFAPHWREAPAYPNCPDYPTVFYCNYISMLAAVQWNGNSWNITSDCLVTFEHQPQFITKEAAMRYVEEKVEDFIANVKDTE